APPRRCRARASSSPPPSSRGSPPHRSLLDRLFVLRALEDALHVDAGRVDLIGVELSDVDELLDLGDGDAPGGGAHRVEVARRLSIDEVAPAVALPRLDDGEVAGDRLLEHARAAVPHARLLALGALGAVAGRRVERGDAGAAGAQPLGERALR